VVAGHIGNKYRKFIDGYTGFTTNYGTSEVNNE